MGINGSYVMTTLPLKSEDINRKMVGELAIAVLQKGAVLAPYP